MNSREKRIRRDIIHNMINIVLKVSILIITVAILISMFKIKSDTGIFGYTARVVISESMEPTIKKNTLNIVKITNIEDIKVGDIVCFKYGNDIIHRVIEINEVQGNKVLHTQGDNNSTADNIEITNEMLLGKVVKTFNNSNESLSKYADNTGSIAIDALYNSLVIHILIILITAYMIIKFVSFIKILVQSFGNKIDKDRLINSIDKDIEELYVIRSLVKEINENTVENKVDTRIEYISNKISTIRTQQAIRDMHRDITYIRNKVKNCYYLDNLAKKIDSKCKENNADESDNSAT